MQSMGNGNEIVSEIILNLDKMKDQIAEAEKQGALGGKKAGESYGNNVEDGISRSMSGIIKLIAGVGAALAGAFTVKAMIHAAAESENAVNRFNSALRVTGQLTPEISTHFQDYAAQLQNITTVSQGTILSNAALLVSVGKLRGEGLEKATKAALDFAAGMNIDVETAFHVVSKAAAGHTEMLNKYGIKVAQVGSDADRFAEALGKINKQFAGFAEAKVNTFSGATAQMANRFDDVLQRFGEIITKSPAMIQTIKFIGREFQRLEHWIVQNQAMLMTWVRDGLSVAIRGAAMFVEALGAIGQFTANYLPKAIVAGQAAIQLLALTFDYAVLAFTGFKLAIQGFSTDEIAAKTEKMRESFRLAVDTFGEMASKVADTGPITTGIDTASTVIADRMRGFADDISTMSAQAGNQIAGALTEPLAQQIPTTFDRIINDVSIKLRGMADMVKTMSSAMMQAFNSVASGLSKGFSQIGVNLASGESAFKNFGKVMLGVLGDMVIQFGAAFISIGLARVLLSYGADATGYALIAVGVGLSILGGALKAMSGGGGGATGGTGGSGGESGGGVSGGPGGGGYENNQLAQEEKKPSTNVQVVVQGNVLDRKETGLALVEILNESFSSDGTVLAKS
jgi:hypothetical protein